MGQAAADAGAAEPGRRRHRLDAAAGPRTVRGGRSSGLGQRPRWPGLWPGPLGDPATDTHLKVSDGDKYHWVQAETLAAAAALAQRTGEGGYWDWYDRIWAYAWRHFVDHDHGAWYRILGPDNRKLTDEKSPAGKVDYHNLGACHEVLDTLAR
jgi:hypothetical protein